MSHAITRLARIHLRNSLAISRRFSADPCEPSPRFKRLKKIQEQYSEETGRPVHLVRGAKDQLLYRTTCALAILGASMSLYLLIKNFVLPS